MNEKMWGIMLFIGGNTGPRVFDELPFDADVWELILRKAEETGVNTFLMDVGDGIELASHPEIAVKGAWSKGRFKQELRRMKDLGIKVIPKFNFATPHSRWMGKYARMVATPEYYRFCHDIISEIYEVFDHPEYIHLGMDEEDYHHCKTAPLVLFRQGDLYWHDLRFLLDCVHETGAKPWIWSCSLFEHPEEFKKHVRPDELLISPWYYFAIKKEHWMRVDSDPMYIDYYNQPDFKDLGLEYVEEDPWNVKFRNIALPLMQEGYTYVPTASVYNKSKHNTNDLVEYFKENAPDNQIAGFLTAPWLRTIKGSEEGLIESFDLLKAAKDKYYGK